MSRLVVVGGNAAGLSAASRARRLDREVEIVVLEKGDVVSFGACGLPYFVEGRVRDWRELQVYPPDRFSRERRIQIRTGAEVASFSPPRREVKLTSGETLAFDKLVLATGALQDSHGIAGVELPHVFSLTSLAGALRLREHLDRAPAGRAVILGAGYIGLETAEVLRARAWRVTIFEREPDVLGRECPDLTTVVRGLLDRFRVELRCGVAVSAIEPDRVLDVPCDLVVLAAGLRPNVEPARSAGIEIGPSGAIRTSPAMETSSPGIFAAGDCAETVHLVSGRRVWIPLGTTANKMGRVAGASAVGARARFPGVAGTSIVRVCGVGIGFTGLSPAQARREGFDPVAVRIEAKDRARYFRARPTSVTLVADKSSGRLLGGLVIGENGVAGRVNVLAAAVTARLRVDEFESLDLCYAPPFAPVWDPLLVAAHELIKLVH